MTGLRYVKRREILEDALHGGAVLERDERGGLDRGPVGERIGERDAELDHVGPVIREGFQDLHGRVALGVPGRDVRDQGGAALGAACREDVGDHPMR
jgi:hypothetical protein